MATEAAVVRVLEAVLRGPPKSAGLEAVGHVKDFRDILRSKNVVGIGVAEKLTAGKAKGELALTVYVIKKIKDKKKLRGDEMVPPAVPSTLTGGPSVPTDVVELGRIHLDVTKARTPIQSGNSIGRADMNDAGTLGAIVAKGKNRYVLSNSHVLAKNGTAKGGKIVYPGRFDGGKASADVIGVLTKFVAFDRSGKLVNDIDAAIARIDPRYFPVIDTTIRGAGPIKGTVRAERGMKVTKVGRTTGKTTGTVTDTSFAFSVEYAGVGEIGFRDQILVTRFTRPGDSGSLVVDAKTKKAVGLHFASAKGGSVSNPIDVVLAQLGVKLVSTGRAQATGRRRATRKRRSRRGNA